MEKKNFSKTSLDLRYTELLLEDACLFPQITQGVQATSKHDESRSFHPVAQKVFVIVDQQAPLQINHHAII